MEASLSSSKRLRRWVLGAVLIACGALIGVVAGFRRPLPLTHERLFAAENLTIVVFSLMLAASSAILLWHRCQWRFWERSPDDPTQLGIANHLLAGIIIVELGWAINRGFWYVFRILKELGHSAYAETLSYGFSAVSTISLALVLSGMIVASRPMMRALLGPYWLVFILLSAMSCWVAGYQSPDAWQIILGCGDLLHWNDRLGKCL